jgi:hypothetical protein
MKKKISVVTACTNGRDSLIEEQNVDGAHFVAYVDRMVSLSVWEQRSAHANFISPRRNSRIHKILIHQYVDTEYSLWMDANVKLLVPAERLVEEWLDGYEAAIFRHRLRNCIYEEAEICAALSLDNPSLIQEQTQNYRNRDFKPNQGLAEACVILRRHTDAVKTFNNAWWSEYSRYSVRDQISLMVAAHQSSLALNLITPTRFEHPYFHCEPRAPGLEHAVDLPFNALEIC